MKASVFYLLATLLAITEANVDNWRDAWCDSFDSPDCDNHSHDSTGFGGLSNVDTTCDPEVNPNCEETTSQWFSDRHKFWMYGVTIWIRSFDVFNLLTMMPTAILWTFVT